MERGDAKQGLLQKIDQIAEELQQLRREVANLLVREAESMAKAESVTQKDNTTPPTDTVTEKISSLEELYALDFAIAEEEQPKEEEPLLPPSFTPEPNAELELVPKEEKAKQSLHHFFVPTGSEEMLEEAFEPRLHFSLVENLSIADRFLFANELCDADQAELMEMLEEIERLSSWSQVESYLYQVRRFNRDEEAVKLLAHFIKENGKR